MIQMTAGDQEERKKDIDLTAKHTPKEAENQKESVQSMFLETLPSTSVDQSEVRRHVIHAFLLHKSMSLEEALNSVEQSLSSEEEAVRLLAEMQIRENCVMVNGSYALSPTVLTSLTPSEWVWKEEEQGVIMQRFPTPKRKRSKIDEAQPPEEPKQRRGRKTKSRPEGEVEKELTLTIPNHTLRFDESLLSQKLRNTIQRNLGMFTTYRSQVENNSME